MKTGSSPTLLHRYLLIFVIFFGLILTVFVFLFWTINSIKMASSDYELFLSRPNELSKKITKILDTGVEDIEHLSHASLSSIEWENTARMLLTSRSSQIRDRKSEQKGIWQATSYEVPSYREAVRGYVDSDGNCHILQILRHENSSLITLPDAKPLFNFDNYCDFFKDKNQSQGVYVSKLLGWYVPYKEQNPNGEEDPYDAVGGQTTYDGIIRMGKINDKKEFSLLALDYRHIYDLVIHIQAYPQEDVIFPHYDSGHYTHLIDPEGWIIAHPKLWDIKGYDRATEKLMPAWDYSGQQGFPYQYTSKSNEKVGINVDEILIPKSPDKPIVRSLKNINGLVRTRIFKPIPFSQGDYSKRGYFAIIVHGLESRNFYSKIEIFYEKVSEAISKTFILTVIIIVLLMMSITTILWYSWQRIPLPILRLTKELSRISLDKANDTQLQDNPKNPKEINSLIHSINGMLAKIIKQSMEINQGYVWKNLAAQASQVAHDIRSPLTALNVVTQHLVNLPEDQRLLIRSAAQRIEDIANDLAGKSSRDKPEVEDHGEAKVQLLSSLIEPLISEKRVQIRLQRGISIESDLGVNSYGLFGRVQPVHFKRVLSNLINNSLEAIGESGLVKVSLESHGSDLKICISDNGKGIPADVLPKLMQEGATYGKETDTKSGSGLGLYHAKQKMESWGGQIEILSEVNKGTQVILTLPKALAPNWFVPAIEVTAETRLVILDDDHSIHQVWQGRFDLLNIKTDQVFHFTSPTAIISWYKNLDSQHGSDILFLCDYELLGNEENGLDVIEELGIGDSSILVTSRFEEAYVRKACERLGVKLLPKNLAGFVPIRLVKHESEDQPEYILIDDSKINCDNWRLMAIAYKKKVRTFCSPDEFYAKMGKINKTTKIYIDSQLAQQVKGEEVAKDIYDMGFNQIYLCTGYPAHQFPNMPWIKEIVTKTPPFIKEGHRV